MTAEPLANEDAGDAGGPAGPPRYDDLAVGDALPSLTVRITRADLVRYAGASTDFNKIHWSARVAAEVGLPGVIAHGMLTMAQAARVVTDWAQDPAAIKEFSVRFTKPVLVPDDDEGVEVEFTGQVGELLDDHVVRVDLLARCGTDRVLTGGRALVRLT